MDSAEKTAQAEQRAEKKAARRAAFIQEVAEAVWAMRPRVTISEVEFKLVSDKAVSAARASAAKELARLEAEGLV